MVWSAKPICDSCQSVNMLIVQVSLVPQPIDGVDFYC